MFKWDYMYFHFFQVPGGFRIERWVIFLPKGIKLLEKISNKDHFYKLTISSCKLSGLDCTG